MFSLTPVKKRDGQLLLMSLIIYGLDVQFCTWKVRIRDQGAVAPYVIVIICLTGLQYITIYGDDVYNYPGSVSDDHVDDVIDGAFVVISNNESDIGLYGCQ